MNMVPADINIIPKDSCQCGIPRLNCDNAQNSEIIELPLAMATIPFQQFKNLNDAELGLQTGTLFKDLDLPFYGSGGALL